MKNKYNKTQTHIKKSKKVHSGPFCFLIWVLKIEIIILAIFFLINVTSNLISDKTKFIMRYYIENTFYSNIKKQEINPEDILKSLNENDYLCIEEKDFIAENLKCELKENFEYIDSNLISKRLKNLKTSYYKKYKYNPKTKKYIKQNQSIYLKKIGGYYNSIFNEINIYEQITMNDVSNTYNQESFNFSNCDKRVYFHELNHLLTKNTFITLMESFILNLNNNKNNISKNILLEMTNEIFTLEYLKTDEEYQYNENMIYIYVLAEILPEDVIRKYKFYDNQSILISGLLDIDNNIDKVYELFNSINNVCKNNYTTNDFKNIHDGYAYFYEKRYNKKMSEDLDILLYFYGTDIQTNNERIFIREHLNMNSYDEILKIIPKGYFSKTYKDNNSKIYIEYTQNGTLIKNSL